MSAGVTSLWQEQAPAHDSPRPLQGERDFDVAIAGGGYTGLWAAYYLKTLAPELSVCVLEAQRCGFGASGRNGGWLMSAVEGQQRLLAALDGEPRRELRSLLLGIGPEVESVLRRHAIECDYHRGGGIYAAARYREQEKLQRDWLGELHALGYGEADFRWLDAGELSGRLALRRPLGAIYTPHVARIQPARLVAGLVRTLGELGVEIYEQSPVTALGEGSLRTPAGAVRAPHRLLALEGYGAGLGAPWNRVLAVQSRIIATEPLPDSLWREIGLADREVFSDASPLINYGQRSADDRLVFGARGAYRLGGRPRSDFRDDGRAFDTVHRTLLDCLPQLAGVPITHRWGGTLGMSRRGVPHAVYDRQSGLGTAGGYLGEGVGASNLLARTLADLVLDRDSELSRAPWAHRAPPGNALRRWEPEPLRWLGYRAIDLGRQLAESVYRREGARWQDAAAGRLLAALEWLRR